MLFMATTPRSNSRDEKDAACDSVEMTHVERSNYVDNNPPSWNDAEEKALVRR